MVSVSVVNVFVVLVHVHPSVRLMLHQYCLLYCVALGNVWLMLVPVLMLVLVVANCVHVPLLLLIHVAVIVFPSVSVQLVYSVGVGHTPVCPLVGLAPFCVGA